MTKSKREQKTSEEALSTGVERHRPPRPRYVPRTVIALAIVVILVLGGGITYAVYSYVNRPVQTPDLIGMSKAEAQTYLRQHHRDEAKVVIQDSDKPADQVVAQDPSPLADVPKDAPITIYVSAGSGAKVVPDVVGRSQSLATGMLDTAGIAYEIETVISTQDSGVVLASDPKPGTTVADGDVVTLKVSLGVNSSSALLPFDLSGLTVVIDPVPPSGNTRDITLEVANRLQGLLEASGAKVVMTRVPLAAASTYTPEARTKTIKGVSGPFAVVSIDTQTGDATGLAANYVGSGATGASKTAADIAKRVADELAGSDYRVTVASGSSPMSSATSAPFVRVLVGNPSNKDDSARWGQEDFAGDVANATYVALGLASKRPLRQQ